MEDYTLNSTTFSAGSSLNDQSATLSATIHVPNTAVISLRAAPLSDSPFTDDIILASLSTDESVDDTLNPSLLDLQSDMVVGENPDLAGEMVIVADNIEQGNGFTPSLSTLPPILPAPSCSCHSMTITASTSPAQLVISVAEPDPSNLEAGRSGMGSAGVTAARSRRTLTCTITWKTVKITIALIAGISAIVTGFLQVFKRN